jgi:hypothetical protein
VSVSNGLTTVVIEQTDGDVANFHSWHEVSLRIQDFIPITSTMQFFFKTSDISPNINITEAGVDHFFIAEADELGLTEKEVNLRVYPNPVDNQLRVEGLESVERFSVFSPSGSEVLSGVISSTEQSIDVSNLNQGVYFLMISSEVIKFVKTK